MGVDDGGNNIIIDMINPATGVGTLLACGFLTHSTLDTSLSSVQHHSSEAINVKPFSL